MAFYNSFSDLDLSNVDDDTLRILSGIQAAQQPTVPQSQYSSGLLGEAPTGKEFVDNAVQTAAAKEQQVAQQQAAQQQYEASLLDAARRSANQDQRSLQNTSAALDIGNMLIGFKQQSDTIDAALANPNLSDADRQALTKQQQSIWQAAEAVRQHPAAQGLNLANYGSDKTLAQAVANYQMDRDLAMRNILDSESTDQYYLRNKQELMNSGMSERRAHNIAARNAQMYEANRQAEVRTLYRTQGITDGAVNQTGMAAMLNMLANGGDQQAQAMLLGQALPKDVFAGEESRRNAAYQQALQQTMAMLKHGFDLENINATTDANIRRDNNTAANTRNNYRSQKATDLEYDYGKMELGLEQARRLAADPELAAFIGGGKGGKGGSGGGATGGADAKVLEQLVNLYGADPEGEAGQYALGQIQRMFSGNSTANQRLEFVNSIKTARAAGLDMNKAIAQCEARFGKDKVDEWKKEPYVMKILGISGIEGVRVVDGRDNDAQAIGQTKQQPQQATPPAGTVMASELPQKGWRWGVPEELIGQERPKH